MVTGKRLSSSARVQMPSIRKRGESEKGQMKGGWLNDYPRGEPSKSHFTNWRVALSKRGKENGGHLASLMGDAVDMREKTNHCKKVCFFCVPGKSRTEQQKKNRKEKSRGDSWGTSAYPGARNRGGGDRNSFRKAS